ncbi:Arginine--tRNA ligase [subsurface metagenome]
MIKQKLVDLLAQAASQAQESGKLPSVALPEAAIEHPQNPEHGDYASSFPLKLARATGINPLTIANDMVGLIVPGPEIASIAVAPPGFINFTLKSDWLTRQVDSVLEAGDSYGDIELGQGSRVQLEFVSVNPTGPLHVGHGRGAILGSTLTHVLTAAGYRVEKEYYINDAGSQVDAFARSLYTRYQQCLGVDAEMPTDGYLGNYMVDLAKEVIAEEGDRFLALPEQEAIAQLRQLGLKKIIEQVKSDLELLGVSFDVWFNEQSLYDKEQYQRAMSLLRRGGYITEHSKRDYRPIVF